MRLAPSIATTIVVIPGENGAEGRAWAKGRTLGVLCPATHYLMVRGLSFPVPWRVRSCICCCLAKGFVRPSGSARPGPALHASHRLPVGGGKWQRELRTLDTCLEEEAKLLLRAEQKSPGSLHPAASLCFHSANLPAFTERTCLRGDQQ